MSDASTDALNVLGEPLQPCCFEPKTGFYRDGYCHTGAMDAGSHVVCAIMTEEFLNYSAQQGNDLTTANPEFGFPGLRPGDKWCLCASRWADAVKQHKAPPVVLSSCHIQALKTVDLDTLKLHANWN